MEFNFFKFNRPYRDKPYQRTPFSYWKSKAGYSGEWVSLERWETYYYQINELLKVAKPDDTILELGSGNGFSSEILRRMGFQVTTVDWDGYSQPSIVADIRKLEFKENSYDILASYQMLEHFNYEESLELLKKMQRATRRFCLLSLPQMGLEVNFSFRLPHIPLFPKFSPFGIPLSLSSKLQLPKTLKPRADFDHQWEIGAKGYSLKRVCNDIEKAGFKIVGRFSIPTNLYFTYFTLEKKDQ